MHQTTEHLKRQISRIVAAKGEAEACGPAGALMASLLQQQIDAAETTLRRGDEDAMHQAAAQLEKVVA